MKKIGIVVILTILILSIISPIYFDKGEYTEWSEITLTFENYSLFVIRFPAIVANHSELPVQIDHKTGISTSLSLLNLSIIEQKPQNSHISILHDKINGTDYIVLSGMGTSFTLRSQMSFPIVQGKEAYTDYLLSITFSNNWIFISSIISSPFIFDFNYIAESVESAA